MLSGNESQSGPVQRSIVKAPNCDSSLFWWVSPQMKKLSYWKKPKSDLMSLIVEGVCSK